MKSDLNDNPPYKIASFNKLTEITMITSFLEITDAQLASLARKINTSTNACT